MMGPCCVCGSIIWHVTLEPDHTSYTCHSCGYVTRQDAEGDLLGEALEVCKIVDENFHNKEDCGCSICTMQNKAKAVLAKAGNQPKEDATPCPTWKSLQDEHYECICNGQADSTGRCEICHKPKR